MTGCDIWVEDIPGRPQRRYCSPAHRGAARQARRNASQQRRNDRLETDLPWLTDQPASPVAAPAMASATAGVSAAPIGNLPDEQAYGPTRRVERPVVPIGAPSTSPADVPWTGPGGVPRPAAATHPAASRRSEGPGGADVPNPPGGPVGLVPPVPWSGPGVRSRSLPPPRPVRRTRPASAPSAAGDHLRALGWSRPPVPRRPIDRPYPPGPRPAGWPHQPGPTGSAEHRAVHPAAAARPVDPAPARPPHPTGPGPVPPMGPGRPPERGAWTGPRRRVEPQDAGPPADRRAVAPAAGGADETGTGPTVPQRRRPAGPLSVKHRTLAVLGILGVLGGGYAFSGSPSSPPEQPVVMMMPVGMVPGSTGDDEWASRARTALTSATGQLTQQVRDRALAVVGDATTALTESET